MEPLPRSQHARRGTLLALLCTLALSLLSLPTNPTLAALTAPQVALLPESSQANDRFGYAVASSLDTILVGASGRSVGSGSNQGAVYVYSRTQGATWGQTQQLVAPDGAAGDSFGFAIALSQNTAVIGAPGAAGSTGAVYIFTRASTSSAWAFAKKLTAASPVSSDLFGRAVALNGDTLVVGAPASAVPSNTNARGKAYVYARNQGGANQWGAVATLTPSDAQDHDSFGGTVAVSPTTIVVGALRHVLDLANPTLQGAAYVFEPTGVGWSEVQILGPDTGKGGQFGWSLALDGRRLVVGAPHEASGAAYLFERGPTSWGHLKTFTPSDGGVGDEFGYAVAINGYLIAVGAPTTAPTGDGSQNVYLFAATAYDDPPQEFVGKELSATIGYYGWAVSLGSGNLIIGAPTTTGTAAAYEVPIAATAYRVSSAFRPDPNGYSFSSTVASYHLLTNAEMIRLVGPSVCLIGNGDGTCKQLTAPADLWRKWAATANTTDEDFGMALSSMDFFVNPALLDKYGWLPRTTWALPRTQSAALNADLINYTFRQFTFPAQAYFNTGFGAELPAVVQRLQTTLDGRTGSAADNTTMLLLKLNFDAQAMALVPYGIERCGSLCGSAAADLGDEVYRIWVYDPFFAGDATRYVDLNLTQNSWHIDMSSMTGFIWEGDNFTLSLFSLSGNTLAAQAQSPQPSSIAGTAALPDNQVWVHGQGGSLLTDAQGQQIGVRNGSFVNEIPGAYVSPVYGNVSGVPMRIYTVPLSSGLKIELSGQPTTARTLGASASTLGVAQFGPGYTVEISGTNLAASEQALLGIAPDGTQISYRASGASAPTLRFARTSEAASVDIALDHATVGAGQTMTATIDLAHGNVAVNRAAAGTGTYDLSVTRVDATGQHTFTHQSVVINAGATHLVSYGAWDGTGSITIGVDQQSDGTVDQIVSLDNSALRVYFPFIRR